MHTAVYLLNRAPTAALDGKTPYQAWYGKKPPMHFLKVFGCVAYIKRLRPHLTKLDDRGQKVVFIGYQSRSKAYRFYDPMTERVHVSRDAIFDESARWDWADTSIDLDLDPFTIEEEYELQRRTTGVLPSDASLSAPTTPSTAQKSLAPATSPIPATSTDTPSPRTLIAPTGM